MDPCHASEPAADDTERFAQQACPHCSAVAPVLLCLATAVCPSCNESFEVAPLHDPAPSSTQRCAPYPAHEEPE
jgi:hypothetical protein